MTCHARALGLAFGFVIFTCAQHVTSDEAFDGKYNVARSSQCHVDTNGCSVPGNLPFFFKGLFTPVCNKHDVCYGCGQLLGWSRSACDKAFRSDMYARCKAYAEGRTKRFLIGTIVKYLFKSKLSKCKDVANLYYGSVFAAGHRYYMNPSPAWCQDPCVKPLGQP